MPNPTRSDWGWFLVTMLLAIAVAVIGEPRPLALIVAGVAAITATVRLLSGAPR